MSWLVPQRTALVLGGGGLKGFAHIGVMRALEERGILPVRYAGTSVGALIAAARVAGVSFDENGATRHRVLQARSLPSQSGRDVDGAIARAVALSRATAARAGRTPSRRT